MACNHGPLQVQKYASRLYCIRSFLNVAFVKTLCFFLIVVFKVQSSNANSFVKIIPNYLLRREKKVYQNN